MVFWCGYFFVVCFGLFFFFNAVSLRAILGLFGPLGCGGALMQSGPLPWKYAKVLAGSEGVGAAGVSWKPQWSDKA